ncbi:MAG: GNAT family N-acetyltransferase [Phycisphaeraceae bacterium]
MPTLTQRFRAIGASDPLDALPILESERSDYHALKPHHYRSGDPATMTRVFAIRDSEPSPSDRYLNRAGLARPIAVLVESLPSLSCRLRDEALDHRYGHLRPKPRSALLTEEIRCISRVIVDPRYRGLGLAVQLVRHALATATTRYTEALAVMGRVSPFFERAGMIAYERPPLASAERALAAMRYAGIDPHELAIPSALEARINGLDTNRRGLVTRELTRWYRTAAGRSPLRKPTPRQIIDAARQRLIACPIYYLHENPHAANANAAIDPDRPTRSAPLEQQRHAQGAAR